MGKPCRMPAGLSLHTPKMHTVLYDFVAALIVCQRHPAILQLPLPFLSLIL